MPTYSKANKLKVVCVWGALGGALAISLSIGGCGGDGNASAAPTTALRVVPSTAEPGKSVVVSVRSARGGLQTESNTKLKARRSGRWVAIYTLTSDGSQGGPQAIPIREVRDPASVGLVVPSRERLVLPRHLKSGEYRLTKRVAAPNHAQFHVTTKLVVRPNRQNE